MHDITIEFDVPVPMRDGAVLRADVYRPTGDGPFPVLVTRHPYNKQNLYDGQLDTRAMVRAGYIVVHQDTRGRFASGGEWIPWKHERTDSYDTIEWAAVLPGSNGKVGMFGGSYLGSTQWSAAIAGAPHLTAIAPITTWSDPEDGLLFRGGAIEFGTNTYWGFLTGIGQIPKAGLTPADTSNRLASAERDHDNLTTQGYWQLPVGALPVLKATGQPDLGVGRALTDPSAMEESRVCSRYDSIDIPSLGFAGWYDVFLQGSLDNYVGMRSRGRVARLIVGPWDHNSLVASFKGGQVGEVNYGLSALTPGGNTVTSLQQDWYDHWLKGMPATDAHESGVLLFVMGINQWRAEDDWPPVRIVDTPVHLGEGSTLSWGPPETENAELEFTYDPADPVPTCGGNLVMATEYPAGPFDQRDIESRDDVLVFTGEPLDDDIEITGRVRATIFASTDGPSTDWVVRLCEVDTDGVSRNIVDGIRRVQTEPGRVDEVHIDLWSTSIVVPAGHRLRVQVTSSNFPRWDRNLNTGEPVTDSTSIRIAQQRIYLDRCRPSRIVLPVAPK
ncbi:CocE/NonD family hydrolase [Nocardia carnea]|uniref:CocE/NonD family hydrolase n=1 Tax=Nocardia carnea TaxID=37328 RepID=UPI002456746E|nr:CocE/NonD family hydrolase [Nocardia carnea]